MYTEIEKNKVKSLSEKGLSLRKISEITGIPKSTLSDWIQEDPETTGNVESGLYPDDECPASNDRSFQTEPSSFPDRFRTISGQKSLERKVTHPESDNFRTNPGQFNPNQPRTMTEHEEIPQNRTEVPPISVSPEWIELKKYELQLQHDREMRKMDQEDALIKLKEQESARKKQQFDEIMEKKTKSADDITYKIMVMANELLNKGNGHEWNYSEAQVLYDDVSELLIEFKTFCNKYNIYFKESEAFRFLRWLKEGSASWLDEFGEEGVFLVTFSNQEIKQIESAININVSRML